MLVLMVRHSVAEDTGASGGDFDRPLTSRGEAGFRSLSAWIAQHNVPLEKIVHSPRLRATQTATLLHDAFEGKAMQESLPWLGDSYTISDLIRTIRGTVADTVAVVGHNPFIAEHATRLIGGGQLQFRPGTVAAIDFHDLIEGGRGRLKWMLELSLFA